MYTLYQFGATKHGRRNECKAKPIRSLEIANQICKLLCFEILDTRISGCYAPFILGLPAGFPRAHARAHFVRFPCRARRGSCCSLAMTGTHIFTGSLSSRAVHARAHFIRVLCSTAHAERLIFIEKM